MTGSIGVIIRFANIEALVKKLGLDFYDLKAGAFKDTGSPMRPMTPEEKAYLHLDRALALDWEIFNLHNPIISNR